MFAETDEGVAKLKCTQRETETRRRCSRLYQNILSATPALAGHEQCEEKRSLG